MITWILFLGSISAAARAEAPSSDGVQQPWSMANISLTIVDFSTPRQNVQIGFALDYPNKQVPYETRCSTVPSTGPNALWKPCGNDFLHTRTTNVVVTRTVKFDLHIMKYGWKKYVALIVSVSN
jgi:hypothetical protein